MNKKTTTTELKKEIRKRYEIGEDLITLALKYKINYGTLRNIASREKWEKGKRPCENERATGSSR